jgi:hypothetical protein
VQQPIVGRRALDQSDIVGAASTSVRAEARLDATSAGYPCAEELPGRASHQAPGAEPGESRRHLSLGTAFRSVRHPVRFGLYLVIAGAPVLGVSGEVFGVVSLRALGWFLLGLLAALAALVALERDEIDKSALAGLGWGVAACACYDSFRLPTVYVFHLWGDFFGRVGGWATGTTSNFLAGYLWRYVGDGAGIGVAFFICATALGVASWPRRRIVMLAVAYAVCPVWTGLMLTDAFAPAGKALFPLDAETFLLSLAGHLIYGAVLGYGFSVSRIDTPPVHRDQVRA